MKGRRVLALGCLVVLTVLAGCSAAGSLDMEPATDERLAEAASRSAEARADEPAPERQLVRQAIENGSATAEGREPALTPGLPFAYDGQYYNVSWTVVDDQQGVEADFRLDPNATVSEGETVAYADLSARDKEAFDDLRRLSGAREEEVGVVAVYNETERERSVLLNAEYEGVRYRGETYAVYKGDPREVTIRTYRYTTTVVANSTAAYADQLREQYLFTLSGLSDAERDIVEEAINDSYYAEDDDNEAFASLVEEFRRHDAIEETEYRGTWLVRYEGEVYRAQLGYEEY